MCIYCSKCKDKKLIEISSVGKVDYSEDDVVVDDGYGNEIVKCVGRLHGRNTKTLFCYNCKSFFEYYYGPENIDTKEYYECLERIDIEELSTYLSDIFIHSPECINFKELKRIFSILKLDFEKITTSIAYNIVNYNKPSLDIFNNDKIPF